MATSTKDRTSKAPAAEPTVQVSDIGPCRKKLSIEVPASAVATELATAFDSVVTQATLPGFRAGKAPRKLIEKAYGKAARQEVRNKLVSMAYSKAVEQHKLRVLGDPEGGEDLANAEIEPNKPIAFTLEVEVAPEFKLPAVDAIPVKKPVREVTDAMVQEEIDRLGLMEGELEPREKAEPGDYCTGHGVIKDKKGDVVLDIDGAVIQIPGKDKDGKGAILGVMVDDFAKQIGLPKADDELTIKAKGPEQHETARIRGEPITISFKVHRVDRIMPASVESLVQRLGIPDEQRLRDALKTRLGQRLMVQQQSAMRRQIAENLLEKTAMELPERLSERQAARALERRRMELMYRGVNPIQVEEQMAELRSASAEVGQRELKLFFILNKVADDLDVKVTEQEVNARIAQLAFERGEKPENLRTELIRRGQVGSLVQQIREHKAMDALISKAAVTEVTGAEAEKL